jgi:hypothetical protein
MYSTSRPSGDRVASRNIRATIGVEGLSLALICCADGAKPMVERFVE